MTARHQIRIGSRRLGRERHIIDATPAPSAGEMLQAARERKGVDLYRAERDTKIRLKYLAALEDGDYAELPPPVYTKGFIRNYALYLGLEPEEVISRWRDELLAHRQQERVVVAPPPRPLAAPRRGVAITPGMIVSLMLSAAVLAFLGFIAWQVLRFAEVPTLGLSSPSSLVSTLDADTVTLAGSAGPHSRVTIRAADGQTYGVIATAEGGWSRAVPLSKGRNDFTITARDPVTERDSEPLSVIITVPLPDVTTSPDPASPSPGTIVLGLSSPASGATSSDGVVTVSGTTTGMRITIAATYLGALEGAAEDDPPPEAPPLRDVTVPVGGAFNERLELAPGRWQVTVTSFATGVPSRSESRAVTVDTEVPIGGGPLTLVIEAQGGNSWLRIVADGELVRPRTWGGPTLRNGNSVTVDAEREIFLRAGNAGMLNITLNGVDLGRLGNRGQVGNWIIEPGSEPRPTTETR